MDIDVTDASSYEIIQILTSYPRGRLVIKHDRIFWDSVSLEPVPNPTQGQVQSGQAPVGNSAGQRMARGFEKMADTLGSMVCMPPR